MIKGVNRQVLEIHDTGSDCFEKALFFVKPEYSTMSEARLNDKALNALRGQKAVPKTRKDKIKRLVFELLGLAAAAGTGSVVTLLIR